MPPVEVSILFSRVISATACWKEKKETSAAPERAVVAVPRVGESVGSARDAKHAKRDLRSPEGRCNFIGE